VAQKGMNPFVGAIITVEAGQVGHSCGLTNYAAF
jgi:hypothetical protein